ncbi:MAG: CheR family methyltransferase [Bacteroidota bacterium]|nr:CheR family methyltransferase [Bacteroidota bacterium]
MPEIGIVETRNIINVINQKYNYDFSDYALTSLKRRIEKIIEQNNLKYPDILINRLTDEPQFIHPFIDQLTTGSTEMFRDPSLWRLLREEILPTLQNETGKDLKIWLPFSVSGDELFSLAIMLHEMNLLDKASILVSALSETSIETMKSGIMLNSKEEISCDNYVRANGKLALPKYYTLTDGRITRDISLIKNVRFTKQNIETEPVPQNIKLVLFRNKMIYFNTTLQNRILKTIYNTMVPNGILAIGTKESISTLYGNNNFIRISKTESIYKRK